MAKFVNKNTAALALSATGLGISGANLLVNYRRGKENTELQNKQLKAITKLTNSLEKVDKSLKEQKLNYPSSPTTNTSPRRWFIFKQKNNSHTKDMAFKGAVVGGTLAGGALPFLPDGFGLRTENKKNSYTKEYRKDQDKGNPTFAEHKTEVTKDSKEITYDYTGKNKFAMKYNNWNPFFKKALIEVGGIAVGAALGALAGAIMDISDHINRKTTVNNRLMKNVVDNLKRSGYREGKDFTRDPKMSNLLKTKVCLVISKSSDEIKLLINMIRDSKLKSISDDIVKNLPTLSTVSEKVTDRYNDLNITTMTSNKGDAVWVTSIAEKFIQNGFPVYLIEVG